MSAPQSGPGSEPSTHRALHGTALVAGLLALGVLFTGPSGVPGYLISIGIGAVALYIGHRAVARSGPLRWAAIVGLVLSYLQVLVSVGLLAARLGRLFAG
ncbi:hypothetical protein MUN76_03515 [Leucobacter rhizosphaerae]|uniref:Uncharacterized protein n=1 Tax=Leucobacter rhizosphaerae TaxID=2932245 RepID=A0ABY4FXM8_9MICO|nr:hypothetical protein [Leucobacter rhizosphaerae]UOQ61055.1 hypothetical protein MUN76_03515 [Leucobacter rhizosphaerae]